MTERPPVLSRMEILTTLESGVRERLREARTSAGYSLRSWADHLTAEGYPVNFGTVSRYEQGAGSVSIPVSYVYAAGHFARVSVSWLLTGQGPRLEGGGDAEQTPARDRMLPGLGRRLRDARQAFVPIGRSVPYSAREWCALLTRRGWPLAVAGLQLYETGQVDPPATYVATVSEITGRSALWLLTGGESPGQVAAACTLLEAARGPVASRAEILADLALRVLRGEVAPDAVGPMLRLDSLADRAREHFANAPPAVREAAFRHLRDAGIQGLGEEGGDRGGE